MCTVLVILPAEQCGGLVQPGRVKGAQIFRQPVNLLVNVRFEQMKDAACCELMRLFPSLHKPVRALFHSATDIFSRYSFKS
ncbi:hypothetical protein D3C80_1637490 [compost metagenome]